MCDHIAPCTYDCYSIWPAYPHCPSCVPQAQKSTLRTEVWYFIFASPKPTWPGALKVFSKHTWINEGVNVPLRRGGQNYKIQVTDRFAYSDKWRITNLDLQMWSGGGGGLKKKKGSNCRRRAAKHVAALGIDSSDQTEAALIRENQSACFRCEPKHADGGSPDRCSHQSRIHSYVCCSFIYFLCRSLNCW